MMLTAAEVLARQDARRRETKRRLDVLILSQYLKEWHKIAVRSGFIPLNTLFFAAAIGITQEGDNQ